MQVVVAGRTANGDRKNPQADFLLSTEPDVELYPRTVRSRPEMESRAACPTDPARSPKFLKFFRPYAKAFHLHKNLHCQVVTEYLH